MQVHERHDPQEAVYLQSSLRLHAIHIKIILHFPRRLSPVDPPSFCFTCARREHSWTLPLSAVTKGLQVALHRQQEPQGVLHPQQQVPKEKRMWVCGCVEFFNGCIGIFPARQAPNVRARRRRPTCLSTQRSSSPTLPSGAPRTPDPNSKS